MPEKSWRLDDAQQLANDYPYTFHKPSPAVIAMLAQGNRVKLIFTFSSDDPAAPAAERMWVEIDSIKGDQFTGFLDNEPYYVHDLKHRDLIVFSAQHITDTDIEDPVPSITEKYIKRCYVSNRVLYGGEKVGYLHRESPDQENDSGWRFRVGDESEDYLSDAKNLSYVSIGAVLREDDSFVGLLDHEANAAFVRNSMGEFARLH